MPETDQEHEVNVRINAHAHSDTHLVKMGKKNRSNEVTKLRKDGSFLGVCLDVK